MAPGQGGPNSYRLTEFRTLIMYIMLNVSLVKTQKIVNVADLLHNADNKLFTLMFTLIAPST